mgnify:FL=1
MEASIYKEFLARNAYVSDRVNAIENRLGVMYIPTAGTAFGGHEAAAITV